jgi:hypothetical protein
MSTTSLTAGEVMDRSAALMNDPAKTDYTYVAQLVYLNMAIDELVEELESSNSSPTNATSIVISVGLGKNKITPLEHAETPHYPINLVEIQEVSERGEGSSDQFLPLGRREFLQEFPQSKSLMFWCWEEQIIKFNPNGASSPREVQLKYVSQAILPAANETSIIGTINARSYLTYKTAALCALYIGEDTPRAQVLEMQAERSLDRIIGINNKGRQQFMTRHRPFRASYKSRGGF